MKGVELPINVLVVVAIAVIVLLGLVALYTSGFIGSSAGISLTAAKNNACSQLLQRNCGTTNTTTIPVNFDADRSGGINYTSNPAQWGSGYKTDNLFTLCRDWTGAPTDRECKIQCSCPGIQ